METGYLIHYGVKGMRWGVRRALDKKFKRDVKGVRRSFKNERKAAKRNYKQTNKQIKRDYKSGNLNYHKILSEKIKNRNNYISNVLKSQSKAHEKISDLNIKYLSDRWNKDKLTFGQSFVDNLFYGPLAMQYHVDAKYPQITQGKKAVAKILGGYSKTITEAVLNVLDDRE